MERSNEKTTGLETPFITLPFVCQGISNSNNGMNLYHISHFLTIYTLQHVQGYTMEQ